MACVCLQRLQALLNSLTAMPPVAGLVPPLPPALMASLNVALAPPGFPSLGVSATASADAALMANL